MAYTMEPSSKKLSMTYPELNESSIINPKESTESLDRNKTYHRKTRIKWRDAVTILAIVVLVGNGFNYFFDLTITLKRKPPLERLLGSGKSSPVAKVQAANSNSHPAPGVSAAGELSAAETNLVLPPGGIKLPISWGDLGKKLIATGVIDQTKLNALYADRGGVPEEMTRWLGNNPREMVMTPENAPLLLNLLWAVGLGTKNPILEKGEMSDPKYGGAAGFASTGGWTLSRGDVMKHFSAHNFIPLDKSQQELVERVSQNIYRPCCGNSTHFPDCNHGMAMLGLLELMAKNGVQEEEMYRAALIVNAYWFPDTYLTLAKYVKSRGTTWQSVPPQELLGASYSSAAGFREIRSQVTPSATKGGGGCGVQ